MDELKIACPSCGGHIAFPVDMHGQVIPCPHCGLSAPLTIPGYSKPAHRPLPQPSQTIYVKEKAKTGCLTQIIAAFLVLLLIGFIASLVNSPQESSPTTSPTPAKPEVTAEQNQDVVRYKEIIAAAQQNHSIPKDLWREIDGEKVCSNGTNWTRFSGKVLEVQPGGVRLIGFYDTPWSRAYDRDGFEFFVANFPYQIAENEEISYSDNWTAKKDGVYSYQNVMGGSTTIRKLDYGTPCEIPEEAIQKARDIAMQIKLQNETAASEAAYKRKVADVTTFMHLETLATNGEVWAQCSLGKHYLNGQGCEMNRELAAKWLKIAAGNGSLEASNALESLLLP